MSKSIVSKIVLIIVGVLVLLQLLFYAAVRTKNIDAAKNERARLTREIEELTVTLNESQEYLDQLQKEYREMVASVPARIMEGYEDPEFVLAGFLDYLATPELEKVDAEVTMQGDRKYVEKPVARFEQNLSITFSVIDLSDARSLVSRILDQDSYPLVVRNFELRSSSKEKISGTLQVSLLIPAGQKRTLSSPTGEGS